MTFLLFFNWPKGMTIYCVGMLFFMEIMELFEVFWIWISRVGALRQLDFSNKWWWILGKNVAFSQEFGRLNLRWKFGTALNQWHLTVIETVIDRRSSIDFRVPKTNLARIHQNTFKTWNCSKWNKYYYYYYYG